MGHMILLSMGWWIHITSYEDARGVMGSIVGNGPIDTSSNTKWGWFHFI